MKDFLGQELVVGDDVIFIQYCDRCLQHGTIKKINKQKVTLEYGDARKGETCIYPNVVIKNTIGNHNEC